MRRAFPAAAFLFLCASLRAQESVTVPVFVGDGYEVAAQNLKPEHLRVTENGKDRRILGVQFDSAEPVWVVFLVEYTRHLPIRSDYYYRGYYFPYEEVIQEEGQTVFGVTMRLAEDDHAAIVTFGNRVHLEQDFTSNRQSIIDVMELLLNNPNGPADTTPQTYGALAETLARLKGKTVGRKLVLVVLGTGTSDLGPTWGEAMQAARESGVQIFFVQVGQAIIQQLAVEDEQYEALYHRHIDISSEVGPEEQYQELFNLMRGISSASAGFAYKQTFLSEGSNIATDVLFRIRNTHRLTYDAPSIPADGKLYKLKIDFVGRMVLPSGKEIKKPKVVTVDGRRKPKEKKKKEKGK